MCYVQVVKLQLVVDGLCKGGVPARDSNTVTVQLAILRQ